MHQYLTKGVVNAKSAAPWYALSRKKDQEKKAHMTANSSNAAHPDLTDQFDRLHMTKQTTMKEAIGNGSEPIIVSNPKVNYLLDFTLNRFCRWLRILGLDAALETEQEEKERTKDAKM